MHRLSSALLPRIVCFEPPRPFLFSVVQAWSVWQGIHPPVPTWVQLRGLKIIEHRLLPPFFLYVHGYFWHWICLVVISIARDMVGGLSNNTVDDLSIRRPALSGLLCIPYLELELAAFPSRARTAALVEPSSHSRGVQEAFTAKHSVLG